MQIDIDLRSHMINDAGIAAVISSVTGAGKVQQNRTDQGTGKVGRIVFERVSHQEDIYLNGTKAGSADTTYTVECLAPDIDDAISIADAVKNALDGFYGKLNSTGTYVNRARVTDATDDYVQDNQDSDTGVHIVSLDLEITHRST